MINILKFLIMKKKLYFFQEYAKKRIRYITQCLEKIKLLNWELHIYGPDYDNYVDRLDHL